MPSKLAIEGGAPIRDSLLPYGRQSVSEQDIDAVVTVLRSEWLTTGPSVSEFEQAFAGYVGAAEAVAVSSGTAALHAAMFALGVGPGDEVIVPAMTFAASANCAVYQGATPIFCDVDPDTLLISPASAEARITSRTKAIVAVDYAGQPCDYDALHEIAKRYSLRVVDDASHSVGASYRARRVGTLAYLNTFSFHPVKHLTTGEGGMITTDDEGAARQMRSFRNHGITTDHRQRAEQGSFFYEMVHLGFNYRLTDFQCALGLSQLRRLPEFVAARQRIAQRYNDALAQMGCVRPLQLCEDRDNAYHLYPVLLDLARLRADRGAVYAALRAEGIGVNVHYVPVHLHPFYRTRFGTGPGLCPVAEDAYRRLLSLPMFAGMTENDADGVILALQKVLTAFAC